MKITEKQPFFLLPVDDYRADLTITDSEGNEMIILPDREFESQFGTSMKEITTLFLDKLKKNSSKRTRKLTKNYRVIAVMLNQQYDEYYEKVKIKWNHSTKIVTESGKLIQHARLDFFIGRYGFEQNKTSAIYLSIKTDPKYKILEEPKIRNWANTTHITPKQILNDVRHKVYRFEETDEPQLIHITALVGVPKTVGHWAAVGVYAGTLVPMTVLIWTTFAESVPKYGLEIIAGTIALLLGERVLVLRDIPLMKKLSRLYVGLFGWCISILIGLMIMSSPPIVTTAECQEDNPCELPQKLSDLTDEISNLRSTIQEISPTSLIQQNVTSQLIVNDSVVSAQINQTND